MQGLCISNFWFQYQNMESYFEKTGFQTMSQKTGQNISFLNQNKDNGNNL